MKRFAKMIFDGGGGYRKLLKFNDINALVSFVILGIPFFVEILLIFNYPESKFELLDYPPYYTIAKTANVFVTFISIFIIFLTVHSKILRKISIFLWISILHVPVIFDLISARVTGALLSNDFMFAIFNTHLNEAWFVIQEYFVFICINLVVVGYAFFFKSEKRYWNKKHCIYALILLSCSILCSNFQPFNKIMSAFIAHIEDLRNIDQFCETAHSRVKRNTKGNRRGRSDDFRLY